MLLALAIHLPILLAAVCLAVLPTSLQAQDTAVEIGEEPTADETALAEEAARQMAAAEAARAAAEAEREQLLDAERARLRTAGEAIEAEAAKLENLAAEIDLIQANALSWRQQATAVAADSANGASADALYAELIQALGQVRRDLGAALQHGGATGNVPASSIAPVDPALATTGEEGRSLLQTQRSLVARVDQLSTREAELLHMQRDTLYGAMLTMNEARLTLLPSLSSDLRSRITGFGDEGFAQVRREVEQIVLTGRYNLATGFAGLKDRASGLVEFRAGEILNLLKFALAILVFRFWRSVGKGVIIELRRSQETRKPQTLLSSIFSYLLRLLGHALRPLDWLIFLLVLDWLFPWFFDPAPIRLLWLLACWTVGGAALVQVIDAMAKGGADEDPRAALRRRSLRLVAAVIIGVGLVLSLTANVVGRGAIYSWLITFSWLLAIPVLIIVTTWWRERIDTLARLGAPSNALLAWTSRNPSGMSGALGRVAAGIVLMGQGAQVVVSRRIRQLSLIHEILGQRAREKANERVIADEESGRYSPISPEEAVSLGAPAATSGKVKPTGAGPQVDIAIPPGHVIAVIADRGYGKTTLLQSLCHDSELPSIYVQVTSENGQDLLDALAEKLGSAADAPAIAKALEQRPYRVAIDDLQRLAVPAIGGLATFDAMVALARHTQGDTAWIFAIDGAAWPYLQRARCDRPMFDDEVRLRPWSTVQIRQLVEQRTAGAGLDPEFEPVTEDAGTILFEEELPPQERAKRAFFKAQTEETGGNPALALERWRRSLFRDRQTGTLGVRTFKAPDIARLAALPSGTLFVLRAILQLDVASFDSIVRITDLPPTRVRETLRTCELLGVVARQGDGYRISLYWLQEVKRLLLAQNLIAGALS